MNCLTPPGHLNMMTAINPRESTLCAPLWREYPAQWETLETAFDENERCVALLWRRSPTPPRSARDTCDRLKTRTLASFPEGCLIADLSAPTPISWGWTKNSASRTTAQLWLSTRDRYPRRTKN